VRCVVVVAVGLVVGLHVFGGWPSWTLRLNVYRLDLDVYRIGAQRWLHGWPLYDLFLVTRVGPPLPFTYPPVAAVLFSPLVVLPLGVEDIVFAAATPEQFPNPRRGGGGHILDSLTASNEPPVGPSFSAICSGVG
jgi:hypothetical protein